MRPEPGVCGRMTAKEESDVLTRIYEDDEMVALLKKYAEVANKSVLVTLSHIELGKFLALNGIILKAKRAFMSK